MKLRHSLFLLIVFSIPLLILATAQESVILLWNGEKYHLNTNPLEEYFIINPSKRPEDKCGSSANWRGYIATWTIKENKLFLSDVQQLQKFDRSFKQRYESILTSIFPGSSEVLAVWYSGNLIIPSGPLVAYMHMGYGSTYESYYVVEILAGRVLRSKKMTLQQFDEFRFKRFEAFKNTAEYKKMYENEIKDSKMTKEQAELFLFGYCSEHFLSMIP